MHGATDGFIIRGLRQVFFGRHAEAALAHFIRAQHQRTGAAAEEIACGPAADLYAIEADTVGDAIGRGELESAAMSHADTLGNMALLDRWRAAVGVRYDEET